MCDDREIHGLAPGFIPSKVLTAGTWKDSKICSCDLICTWLMYLMSLSHSHRVSTGLAASQEMLLRATCLHIKGAFGFPKKIVLFVVLFYVQPCCVRFILQASEALVCPTECNPCRPRLRLDENWNSVLIPTMKPFLTCPCAFESLSLFLLRWGTGRRRKMVAGERHSFC